MIEYRKIVCQVPTSHIAPWRIVMFRNLFDRYVMNNDHFRIDSMHDGDEKNSLGSNILDELALVDGERGTSVQGKYLRPLLCIPRWQPQRVTRIPRPVESERAGWRELISRGNGNLIIYSVRFDSSFVFSLGPFPFSLVSSPFSLFSGSSSVIPFPLFFALFFPRVLWCSVLRYDTVRYGMVRYSTVRYWLSPLQI